MGSRRRTDEDTAPRSLRKRPHSVLESPYTTDNTRVRGKVSEKRDSLAEVEGSEYEDGDNDIEDDDEQPVRKPGRNRKSLDAVAGRKKKPAERPLEKASTRRDNLENVESSEEEPLKQLAAKRCTLGLGSEGGSKERQVEQPLTASPDERPGRKWVAPAAPIAHAVRKKDSAAAAQMSVIASLPLYQPPTSRQDLKSDGRSPTCTKADPSNTTLDSNTVLPSHPKRKRTSVAIPQGQKDDDQLSTSNGTKSSALEERVLSLPGHGRGKPSATNLQSEEDDGAAVAPSQTTQLEETPKSPLTRPERRESEGASSPARPLDDHTSASPGIQHRSARSDRQLDVALLSMSSANLHRLAQRVQVEVGRRLGLENRD